MKIRALIAGTLISLVLIAILLGCADEHELYIVIGGGYAVPMSYINVNQEFVWINQDHEAHTVTSSSIEYGSPNYFDFTLQPGDSVEYTITQPGVYIYSDTLNPTNVAEIIAK